MTAEQGTHGAAEHGSGGAITLFVDLAAGKHAGGAAAMRPVVPERLLQ
jgi:hypothetical protein